MTINISEIKRHGNTRVLGQGYVAKEYYGGGLPEILNCFSL